MTIDNTKKICLDDLLVAQVSGLVREIVDAIDKGDNWANLEAHFYGLLAAYCTEKQKLTEIVCREIRASRGSTPQNEVNTNA